jgi:hypothetical protein
VPAWTTELEFAYDFGHLYVLDGARHWSDDERVDLRMPDTAGFSVPLRIEAWGAKPALELDGWQHVTEFSLALESGTLALASGGCGAVTVQIEPGAYRARWSGKADGHRLQLWPGPAGAPRSELRRVNGHGRDLGDLPALLEEDDLHADGRIAGTRVRGNALQLYLRLEAADGRSWRRTIRCDGVVRWQASSERFSSARLYTEHPGLLPFADERGGLSFRGTPADPERLADALCAAHADLAGRHVEFERGLAERLAVGYGQLASGPVTLLRRYAEAAEAHGVATHLTLTGPGRTGLALLELGETFVVAERFSAELQP